MGWLCECAALPSLVWVYLCACCWWLCAEAYRPTPCKAHCTCTPAAWALAQVMHACRSHQAQCLINKCLTPDWGLGLFRTVGCFLCGLSRLRFEPGTTTLTQTSPSSLNPGNFEWQLAASTSMSSWCFVCVVYAHGFLAACDSNCQLHFVPCRYTSRGGTCPKCTLGAAELQGKELALS